MGHVSDFDWSEVGEDIVVRRQAAVAAYRNPLGGFVIRQQDSEDGDQVIILTDDSAVRALIKKLQDLRKGDV